MPFWASAFPIRCKYMYKAIIFDLDGTLLDTSRDINGVLNDVLEHFGIPKASLEDTVKYVGNGARELVRRAIGSQNEWRLDEINCYYVKEFAACDNERATIYGGEEHALRAFRERGIKLAILSNKPQSATEHVYDLFFKDFCFDFVQGQKAGMALKPAPDGVFAALEALGVKREECLFVGDGETDVLTAKNAGVDGVSVLWGFRTKEQLQKAGATRFVSSYEELEKLVLCE